MIKKADIILAVVLLIIGVGSPFLMRGESGDNMYVELVADGELLGTYDLSEDRVIIVGDGKILPPENADGLKDYNRIEIKGGCVSVSEADCGGKDCIRMGSISKSGQAIACLPHRLLITIKGGTAGPDVII